MNAYTTRARVRAPLAIARQAARLASARKGALLAAASFAAAGLASQAHASGFELEEHSIKANGRAWSGEAAERGAQQMWWNPAAIGGIQGIESYAGLSAIRPSAKATNRGTTVQRSIGGTTTAVGGDQVAKDPVSPGWLPDGGFAIGLGKIAVGFTTASPYSFTTNWDNNGWMRYSADRTRLRTFDFQPTVAFAPNENISIGAALNAEYQRATLTNFLPDPLSPTNPDGYQKLKGDGWDFGYSVGFQFHNDKVDLGAAYKSSIKHNLTGTLTISGIDDPLSSIINQVDKGAEAHFRLPWQVNVSARYHVSPQLTVEGQISRTGWEKFQQIQLSNLPALLGNQVIPENYNNTFAYSLGADYKVNEKLTLRTGVQRDLSPISDGNRDPRVPDGNRWTGTVGASYEMNQFMGVDLSFGYTKIASNPIDKTVRDFDQTIVETTIFNDGYLNKAHALTFGLGGHMHF